MFFRLDCFYDSIRTSNSFECILKIATKCFSFSFNKSNVRQLTLMPRSGPAKLFTCCFLCQQVTWAAYHANSLIGQNPRTLKWDKPNIMRDIFLTTLPRPHRWRITEAYESQWTLWDFKEYFPNPFSVMYCSSAWDFFLHAVVGLSVGAAWTHRFGLGQAIGISFLGGIFAGGCFQFQSRMHPEKNLTPYDACSTSSGALTAMCSSLLLSKYAPKHRVCRVTAVAFITYKLFEEYYLAPLHLQECRDYMENRDKMANGDLPVDSAKSWLLTKFYGPINNDTIADPRIREWGSVGGLFLGMMWAALVFSPIHQRASLQQFQQILAKYR